MDYSGAFYPESRFGGFTDTDGTISFYTRVNSLLTPSSVLLDFGCGRGAYAEDPVPLRRELRIFKGKVGRVVGMDVDEHARANPFVDEFRMLIPGDAWSVEGNSIDIVIADSVVEHLPVPAQLFSECKRVLKPGGYLCIRTTNVLSYVGLASRMVPNKLHARVLGVAQENRKPEDVFPTLYRCNTVQRVRRMMSDYGFDHACYGFESEPRYLAFSKLAYALGVLHQKFAPGFMKLVIFAFGRSAKY